MPFLDSLDIANRAIQHCGAVPIVDVTEDSKNNQEIAFAYDKLRRAELRRNVWRFATKKAVLRAIDVSTLLLDPPLYSASKTYLSGDIVKDANNQYWFSVLQDNVGNTPGGNNDAWDGYFGPLTVSLFSTATSYFTGELVYKAGAVPGSYGVYMSLKTGNTDVPDVATAWDPTVTYYSDQVVSYLGSQWRNLLPINLGITPATGPAVWASATTYSIGNQVTGSNHKIYTSATNGNVGNNPTTDSGTNWTDTNTYTAWSNTPTITVSSDSWRPLGNTALKPFNILYPVGAGPFTQMTTRNAYYMPAGYLRRAPRDPKAGSTSYLGAPSGLPYEDWTFEGNFLVSTWSDPIIFRFVADVQRVRDFDDMFCEGLAARIAIEVVHPLTQSNVRMQSLAAEYAKFMSEARLVNAIEIGSEEPAEDDFIQCRV